MLHHDTKLLHHRDAAVDGVDVVGVVDVAGGGAEMILAGVTVVVTAVFPSTGFSGVPSFVNTMLSSSFVVSTTARSTQVDETL